MVMVVTQTMTVVVTLLTQGSPAVYTNTRPCMIHAHGQLVHACLQGYLPCQEHLGMPISIHTHTNIIKATKHKSQY